MKIVMYPAVSLFEKSVKVVFDEETLAFVEEFQKFYKTLAGRAIGLAAPQVGHNIRLFIAHGELYLNPKMGDCSEETYETYEGCLSLPPNDLFKVRRHQWIMLTWSDLEGKEQTKKFDGFEAEVIQHEYDHLEGVLINQDVPWKDARQNLKKAAEEFPAIILDCLDAAYLAGLEAVKK